MTTSITESGTSTVTESDDRLSRPRRHVWRSPADQPRWARPALLGIAALAAFLYTWNITGSGYASYYSVAARSMSVSWKAFLFTALDPSATITLDKIGGFLWPQALSARVFGFHAWALTLPQCVEGVVSVLAMYRMVRRWQGPAAGLLAAGSLALTPVAVSMFGHAMLDGMAVMCLTLAADQYQRAVGTARLRPLLFSGLWIGLGFQAKMMEAWIIVPALLVGYLVAAPVTLRRRTGHLLAAGAVMLAVSLSWVALMTFTPQDARPYADGSTGNSAFSMVFGYNGFNRFDPGLISGADDGTSGGPGSGSPRDGRSDQREGSAGQSSRQGQGQGQAPPSSEAASGSQGPNSAAQGPSTRGGDAARMAEAPATGSSGRLKLLRDASYTTQIGWLYPLALLGLIAGLVRHRKGPRTDQARAGYLMWGVWLATTAAVLSSFSFAHNAYLATLAPAIAALSAAGTVELWRAHRTARAGWRLWVLPAVIAAEAAWTVHLASDHTDFAPWLIPVVCAAALIAVMALGRASRSIRIGGLRVGGPGIAVTGLLAGCVAMFAAPTAWSLSVLDERYAGSAFEANAGPPVAIGAADGPDSTSLTAGQRRLLAYVEQHNGNAEFTLSADSWSTAAPYIYAKGLPVLPLGGYSGTTSPVTLAAYKHLVAEGRLRFALLSGPRPAAGEPRPKSPPALGKDASETLKINSWVYSDCTAVAPATYGVTVSADEPMLTLYKCA
ncbi:ArnT family glycosyltransferase [Streptomyces sp. NPDC058469]|uniref:ArnT family glycosyltransferase n=1 Tax=Streptomyces sp. NPDC058469 TaxID=3346514 RepID=UPI00366601C9